MIYETKARSILKAISFRIIEVSVDTWILSYFVETRIAVGLAIALEGTCLMLHYGFERVWNRFNYGRIIK